MASEQHFTRKAAVPLVFSTPESSTPIPKGMARLPGSRCQRCDDRTSETESGGSCRHSAIKHGGVFYDIARDGVSGYKANDCKRKC